MYLLRLALLLLLMATGLNAHDIHRSTTEAEYDATTQKLEVSLTVFISDLELALVRQAEREMSFTKTPAAELDAQILALLAKTFVVTHAAGQPASIAWVGRKREAATEANGDPEVTLFFEIALPDGLAGTSLRHEVFCDHFKDQSNLLHLRSGAQSVELRFTRNEPLKPLAFAK